MRRSTFLLRGIVLLLALSALQRLQLGVSISTIIHHPDVLWRSAEYALRQG